METILIAAMDENRGIGINNTIPWNNPADMKRFRQTTMCNPIIMGRKTFESLKQPLGGRLNIVVTSKPDSCKGVLTSSSLEDALNTLRSTGSMFEKVYIIGGGQIYGEALRKCLVGRIELSIIPGTYECDTYFPHIPAEYVPAFECTVKECNSSFRLKVLELIS